MIAAGMVALILLNAMIKLLFVKNSINVREWFFGLVTLILFNSDSDSKP
jgi:hypothetical protein